MGNGQRFTAMKGLPGAVIAVVLGVSNLGAYGQAADGPSNSKTQKGMITMQAKGGFEVKIDRQTDPGADAQLSRMTIDKQFHGDLDAHSVGQMLAAGTDVKGSAGYVAIEKVTGKLGGRSGSFVLQHNATMNRGAPELNIIVVPDSGTGELAGLTGKMNIVIADGKHSYEFDYQLTGQWNGK